jgi:uncharacterized pyridoxamine 5'-phosphate oxidase family protein
MDATSLIALASSVDDMPDVRLLLFIKDEQKEGTVYIATFKQSPKVAEFEKNDKVAFVTAPDGVDAVRVSNATIKISDRTVDEVKDSFIRKSPNFQDTIDQAGPMMVIYEIHFNEADVIVGFNNTQRISL